MIRVLACTQDWVKIGPLRHCLYGEGLGLPRGRCLCGEGLALLDEISLSNTPEISLMRTHVKSVKRANPPRKAGKTVSYSNSVNCLIIRIHCEMLTREMRASTPNIKTMTLYLNREGQPS